MPTLAKDCHEQLCKITKQTAYINRIKNEGANPLGLTHYAKVKHMMEELQEDSLLLSLNTPNDIVLQQLYDSLLASNIGSFFKIEILLNKQDIAAATLLNNNVEPSNVFETNQKILNTIYLNSYATSNYTFDETQQANLMALAHQNPLIAGEAVYQARAMLNIDVDDFASTYVPNMGTQFKQETDTTIYYVSQLRPNPSKGSMQLDYMLNNDQIGELNIFDMNGKQCSSYVLMPKNTTLTIEEPNLKNGTYLYQITVNGKLMNHYKLIIAR